MPVKATVNPEHFNRNLCLPYELRLKDFEIAMEDVYDFFNDVNTMFEQKGLPRLEESLRPANMSGMISDMLTASMAKHSRSLCQNRFHNGHPDLVVRGVYANDSVKSGEKGVEIKATRKSGGAVDTHGAREQWMCVFVYRIDSDTEPVTSRRPTIFSEIYLNYVSLTDFRRNERGQLGTPTSTLDRGGIKKLRLGWVYRLDPT